MVRVRSSKNCLSALAVKIMLVFVSRMPDAEIKVLSGSPPVGILGLIRIWTPGPLFQTEGSQSRRGSVDATNLWLYHHKFDQPQNPEHGGGLRKFPQPKTCENRSSISRNCPSVWAKKTRPKHRNCVLLFRADRSSAEKLQAGPCISRQP